MWNGMDTAPRDGSLVILATSCHGVIEARFEQGHWTEDTPVHPREYTGSLWICGDDVFEIMVEETPDGYNDEEALGWLPRDTLPPIPKKSD